MVAIPFETSTMNLAVNIAARFPDRGQFHPVSIDGARASLTQGCRRVGRGHLSQVLSGVFVSVVLCTAGVTGPTALAKSQVCVDHATSRAGLARCKPTVRLNHNTASKCSLVVDLPEHLTHCGVIDGLGKARTGHPLDAQVLNANEAKIPDKPCREVVRHVLANIGDPLREKIDIVGELEVRREA